MPTKITLGHLEAHEKLTARLYFKPAGDTGYLDAGNVQDYKYTPEKNYVGRVVAENGFRRTVDEQVDTVTDRWEFTLDEHDELNLKLLYLGSSGADAVQAAVTAPTGTATLTDVLPGRSYFLGKVALSSVVVKVASTTMVEGTDYTLDAAAGVLTVLPSGTILAQDDLTVTFGCAAITHQVFTGQDHPLFRGDVRILETNQHSQVPLREIAFTGVMYVTAWPEQSGEFGKYTVRVTPTTKPVIKRRTAA